MRLLPIRVSSLIVLLILQLDGADAFVSLTRSQRSFSIITTTTNVPQHSQQQLTALEAKRKRKRKKAPRKRVEQTAETTATTSPAAAESGTTLAAIETDLAAASKPTTVDAQKVEAEAEAAKPATPAASDADVAAAAISAANEAIVAEQTPAVPMDKEMTEVAAPISDKEKDLIGEIAKFEFTAPPPQAADDMPIDPSATATPSKEEASIPLPSIQDALQQKQLEQELAQMEQEQEAKRVKIKRSDKDAFTKLLEQNPFADADDSFFVEEEYGTVSALLGEKAKPFLGLPFGALQIAHFIGALGIVLMAFVEYPGFPLTNLPTPLRSALQGGLIAVYAINTVLAVYAVFKASERGQPVPLWVAKTFSVGGLALDQLTQLPTLEQIKEAESRKGARALKKNKR